MSRLSARARCRVKPEPSVRDYTLCGSESPLVLYSRNRIRPVPRLRLRHGKKIAHRGKILRCRAVRFIPVPCTQLSSFHSWMSCRIVQRVSVAEPSASRRLSSVIFSEKLRFTRVANSVSGRCNRHVLAPRATYAHFCPGRGPRSAFAQAHGVTRCTRHPEGDARRVTGGSSIAIIPVQHTSRVTSRLSPT